VINRKMSHRLSEHGLLSRYSDVFYWTKKDNEKQGRNKKDTGPVLHLGGSIERGVIGGAITIREQKTRLSLGDLGYPEERKGS